MITNRGLAQRILVVLSGMAALAGCADRPIPSGIEPDVFLARKTGGGPTVASTDPAMGGQGMRLLVRILGSGYNATAVASWERNGAADPKVVVNATTFVSSSEVVADITIADDADLDLYDVAVEIMTDGGRKKGVGAEQFEVTIAYTVMMNGAIVPIPLSGAELQVNRTGPTSNQLMLGLRYNNPTAGTGYTAFSNTALNFGACQVSVATDAATRAALEAEFTRGPGDTRGFAMELDMRKLTAPGKTATSREHRLGTHYINADAGSPLFGYEVDVGIRRATNFPEFGDPKVTWVSETTLPDGRRERVFRFHAGFGAVRVWQRAERVLGCPLGDDVYVTVREG
jgi:hypothetical protein